MSTKKKTESELTYQSSSNEIFICRLEDLPRGEPLEKPLHPKRRRHWQPSPTVGTVEPVPSTSHEDALYSEPNSHLSPVSPETAQSTPSSLDADQPSPSRTPKSGSKQKFGSPTSRRLRRSRRSGRRLPLSLTSSPKKTESEHTNARKSYSHELEDLPRGEPLEKPLRPRRRRQWQPLPTADNQEGTVEPVPSTSHEDGLHSEPTSDVDPLEAQSGCTSLDVDQSSSSQSLDYGERPQNSTVSSPPHSSSNKFNYGSEDDSDDDDDENLSSVAPMPVPRTLLGLLDSDDDEMQPAADAASEPSPPLPSDQPPAVGTDHEPSDMYNFQWRAFPHPQISPNLRRESFSKINCGPTASYADPYAAFTAIWDRQIMQHICAETNKYAEQYANQLLASGNLRPNSRIKFWKDIQIDDLYLFFGIVLAMGMVVKTRLMDYWSNSNNLCSTPGFSTHMTTSKFYLLNKCLHFNDNNKLNKQLLTRPAAKLFKIKPILDHLNKRFSHLYNLGQNIALDGSLTQWKGWLDINQYIPNKTAAMGIKTYEVCDPQSGYLWKFEVHSDFEPSQDPGPVSGTIPSIVLRLLRGLENKGHTVWMDNYYNSPALARKLKSIGFDCVGTLRTNRQYVPVQLATLHKQDMKKGEIIGCTSGDVDLLVWRDKNKVGLISTYHGSATTHCGDTLKPILVQDYNLNMGGIDKKDQMLAMYPIERKRTKVWYKKFFRRVLNVSVLNAYILYKNTSPTTTHRDFREQLVNQLVERHRQRDTLNTASTFTGLRKFSAEFLNHLPAEYPMSGGKGRLRRVCAVCKERISTYCPGCNVTLCTYRLHENKKGAPLFSCFRIYHT